jgi:cell fate (sporulation/competence/biofilm development) regulator YlbF (YheA/YmcA/DUF963 family)
MGLEVVKMSSTWDMSSILLKAYELGELIQQSQEVQHYLDCRMALEKDDKAQRLIARFVRKKEEFQEVERVGWWHPDYRKKDAELRQIWDELQKLEVVRAFKSAEDRVDKMLYHISRTLARSVSHTIKVPRNDEDAVAGCGGGCGGCGNRCNRRCG